MPGNFPSLRLIALAVIGISAVARAGPPVILVDLKVSQYREAADRIQAQVPNAVRVDPAAATDEELRGAPLVVAIGQTAFTVTQTRAPATPVVFCMVLGVTKGTLTPTVTGVPLETAPAPFLRQLRTLLPSVRRIGVVFNPEKTSLMMAEAQKEASALGLTLVEWRVSKPTEVRAGVAVISKKVDVLWLPPDPQLFSQELATFLLSFAAERKLPMIGFLESFTKSGALASVSADYTEMGQRAGRMAASILAKPAASRLPLPPPEFTEGKLSVNMSTARALKIDVASQLLSSAKLVAE
jgi:putative ABC transport system substrate-binding protein